MAKITMDKIVRSVALLSGLTQKECRAVIDDYIYVLKTAILNGMEVELKDVGYFSLKYRPAKESRLIPDVTKGGAMSWCRPKEEYNYPMFTVYKGFAKKVREVTEGHAFRMKNDKGVVQAEMTPEEYEKFTNHLKEINYDSEDFDDEDYVGRARVERDVIYGIKE